jgi:esterase/lipase
VGMSMGGVSAVQLAIRSNDVAAVVLLAPYFGWSRRIVDLGRSPLGLWLIRLKLGDTRSFKYLNERHKYFWTTTYRIEALQPLFTMGAIQRATDLGLLTKRTLVFYSRKDEFVSSDDIESRFMQIGSGIKRLVHLDDATEHVITGEIVNPKTVPVTVNEMVRFLSSLRN